MYFLSCFWHRAALRSSPLHSVPPNSSSDSSQLLLRLLPTPPPTPPPSHFLNAPPQNPQWYLVVRPMPTPKPPKSTVFGPLLRKSRNSIAWCALLRTLFTVFRYLLLILVSEYGAPRTITEEEEERCRGGLRSGATFLEPSRSERV